MAGISIDDLLKTMEKAGVPMNTMSGNPTYKNRSDLMTASRGQIAGAVAGTPPNQDVYRQQYMQKIAKIAEMDQKLAGVYGDPNSNLYIEHAGQRENAVMGARPAMEGAADTVINTYNQDVQQFNQTEKEKLQAAQDAYDELIAKQKEGEKQKGEGGSLKTEIDRLLGNDTVRTTDLNQFLEDSNTIDLNNFIEDDSSANLKFTL